MNIKFENLLQCHDTTPQQCVLCFGCYYCLLNLFLLSWPSLIPSFADRVDCPFTISVLRSIIFYSVLNLFLLTSACLRLYLIIRHPPPTTASSIKVWTLLLLLFPRLSSSGCCIRAMFPVTSQASQMREGTSELLFFNTSPPLYCPAPYLAVLEGIDEEPK